VRVVLFGAGGPLARAALAALAARVTLVAVVVPEPRPAGGVAAWLRRVRAARARRPWLAQARELGVPVHRHPFGEDAALAAALAPLRPDVLCVASYPRLLRAPLLALPARAALNLHPSLLPRHRGPAPLFWTYVHDDREAGVTVHDMDEGADTGPVRAQAAVPLARGRPLPSLYAELARLGGALLADTASGLAADGTPGTPQDERRATREPSPARAAFAIDPARWPAERVWHVLAGLGMLGLPLLRDARGRPVPHGPATGWRPGPGGRPPGTVERAGAGLRVHAVDGVVEVAPAPRRRRIVAGLRRLAGRPLPRG
jgi:methionyl-tRNA formyltransferase